MRLVCPREAAVSVGMAKLLVTGLPVREIAEEWIGGEGANQP
jgi:hypothetical protein